MQTEWSYDELTQAVKEFITPDASCRQSPELAEFHRVSCAGVFDFWNTLTADVQNEQDKTQIRDMLRGLP